MGLQAESTTFRLLLAASLWLPGLGGHHAKDLTLRRLALAGCRLLAACVCVRGRCLLLLLRGFSVAKRAVGRPALPFPAIHSLPHFSHAFALPQATLAAATSSVPPNTRLLSSSRPPPLSPHHALPLAL